MTPNDSVQDNFEQIQDNGHENLGVSIKKIRVWYFLNILKISQNTFGLITCVSQSKV